MKAYIITQAFAKRFLGMKTCSYVLGNPVLLFGEREDANEYLYSVINNRKKEIQVGINGRDKDNLDPEKGLDFCINEVDIKIDESKMLKRGWDLINKSDI